MWVFINDLYLNDLLHSGQINSFFGKISCCFLKWLLCFHFASFPQKTLEHKLHSIIVFVCRLILRGMSDSKSQCEHLKTSFSGSVMGSSSLTISPIGASGSGSNEGSIWSAKNVTFYNIASEARYICKEKKLILKYLIGHTCPLASLQA